jgi:Kef-type K+ transport system membrane component KefB
MKKVFLFSVLLLLGICGSQLFLWIDGEKKEVLQLIVKNITLVCVAFIMIHEGLEFVIDKSLLRNYGWDYFVAFMVATLPWLLCSAYFFYFFEHDFATSQFYIWTNALLLGRFASPTSPGILFSMLSAANLETTWVYKKARTLVVFNDLDTVILLIPIKMLISGFKWESVFLLFIITSLLYLAWKKIHSLSLPINWYFIVLYSITVTFTCEFFYFITDYAKNISPIQLEILLPAFVLGSLLIHRFLPSRNETKARFIIAAIFMFFVGLSMPSIEGVLNGEMEGMSLNIVFWHVLAISLLSNLGKMFPIFCYQKEASLKERIALSLAMCPRGEMGAAVIIVSMDLVTSIDKNIVFIAMLSLLLNSILSGPFVFFIKKLLSKNALVH